MTRIGITGHRGLPVPTARLVADALREALAGYGVDVTGITALADGADQLFARAIVDQGGQIEVIVPAARYREDLPSASHPNTTICCDRPARCTGSSSPSRHRSLTWPPAP